jgi:hypothetical protein
MRFEVKPNTKYLILEKPNSGTPKELKEVGRAKLGGKFFEFAAVPWNEKYQKYDTGLDKLSSEFIGKDPKEVDKILKDRKALVEYLNALVERHPSKNENEFLAEYRLRIYHNQIVDTSDIDMYLRLFLAMRGTAITPEKEKGNIAKYGNSMYMIVDTEAKVDAKKELAAKKLEAKRWLLNKLDANREEAIEYLRYEGVLAVNQDKEDAILLDVFEKKIEDYEVLESFLYSVKKIPLKDVKMHNGIKKLVQKGVIRKEKNGYVYDGAEVGVNLKAAVHFFNQKENIDLATKLFG